MQAKPFKVYEVTIRAFDKHIVERVNAYSREDAQARVTAKYGIEIFVRHT